MIAGFSLRPGRVFQRRLSVRPSNYDDITRPDLSGTELLSPALARQFWEPPEGEVHPAERLLVAGRPATFTRPS